MIKRDAMSALRHKYVYFALLLPPLFWGAAFGSTKHALTELPPLTLSAVRFLIAGLLMVGWVTVRREWNWTLIRRHWLGLFILGLTGAFLYNYFFATGLQYTSSLNAALVVVVNPVITASLAVFLLGEPWHWRIGSGVAISLVGVLVVITQGSLEVIARQSFGQGEVIVAGAMLSWVTYTIVGKFVNKHVGSVLATTVSTMIGAILLLLASLSENGWKSVLTISAQTTGELIFLSLFATIVAFLLFNWGVQQIGATKASAYINLMPVNAMWVAAILYSEPVLAPQLIGMALILSGVLLTTQTKHQTRSGTQQHQIDAPILRNELIKRNSCKS